MKKIFILLFFIIASCRTKNTENSIFDLSKLNSLQMLLMDGRTIFNITDIPKGVPVILIYFNPDCPHCQDETRSLVKNMEALKNVKLFFLTESDNINDIIGFSKYFRLEQFNNIRIGKDYNHSFYHVYKPSAVPFIAIYDNQKQLVKIYHEEASIDKILSAIHI